MTEKLPKIENGSGKLLGVIIIILFLISALVFLYGHVTSEGQFTGVIQKIEYSELNYTKGSVYFVNENDSITPPVLIFNRSSEDTDLKIFLEESIVTKKQVKIYYVRFNGQIIKAMYANATDSSPPYERVKNNHPWEIRGIVHDIDIPDINGIGVVHLEKKAAEAVTNSTPTGQQHASVFISDEIDANKFLIEANNTKKPVRIYYKRLDTPGYGLIVLKVEYANETIP